MCSSDLAHQQQLDLVLEQQDIPVVLMLFLLHLDGEILEGLDFHLLVVELQTILVLVVVEHMLPEEDLQEVLQENQVVMVRDTLF